MYLLYYVCIVFFTLNAGLLATGQYSEGPVTGHLDDLNLVVTNFMFGLHVKQTLPPGDNPIAVNKYYYYYYYYYYIYSSKCG